MSRVKGWSLPGVSLSVALLALGAGAVFRPAAGEEEAPAGKPKPPAATLEEARFRAQLLHETIHGTLQVVHRDFFREDEALAIPSKSFEDVFSELEETHGVQVHWMAVNAQAMSVDNKPDGPFEEAAVKALSAGQTEYEAVADGSYQFAGAIRLSATCLGCHLPRRSSNEDRVAGLVIRMPVGE